MNESLKLEASDLDDLGAADAPCDQWAEDRRSGADKAMPTGRVCKNTAMLGVKGMEDPGMASAMMSEWRKQMADEGKARPGTRSIGQEFAALIVDEKQS